MAIQIIVAGAGGRMGSTITSLVLSNPDLKLVAAIDKEENHARLTSLPCPVYADYVKAISDFSNVEAVLIDFTSPENTMNIAKEAHAHKVAHIIGTTGLNETQKNELANYAKENKVFLSPNMSIGINVLLNILPKLTAMLGENYDVEMVELHHNKKKDSPSGTALRLAECLAEAKNWKLDDVANYHREGIIGERPKEEIGVQTIRGGDVVGVHTMYFMGPGERIEVTHQAHSRENFAQGALRAAQWIATQQAGKVYDMSDVLGI